MSVAVLALLGPLAMVFPVIAAPQSAPAAEASAVSIVVRVHGVRSSDGQVVAVLYGDNPDDFLRAGRRLGRVRAPATIGVVRLELNAPRPGRYAVAVYHDENGNRKLDTAVTGLPAEGFGLSNNPRIWLRLPRLADAAFSVDAQLAAVEIDLRY